MSSDIHDIPHTIKFFASFGYRQVSHRFYHQRWQSESLFPRFAPYMIVSHHTAFHLYRYFHMCISKSFPKILFLIFLSSQVIVPHSPPPIDLVFMVLVSYAYGFLGRLVTCFTVQTMPLRSTSITEVSSLLQAAALQFHQSFPIDQDWYITHYVFSRILLQFPCSRHFSFE